MTINNPGWDVSPLEVIRRLDKRFLCRPGTCGAYSSTGFMLLGLVAAQVTGAESWQQLDQMAAIPTGIRSNYPGTVFPTRGRCSAIPKCVHQYYPIRAVPATGQPVEVDVVDLYNGSCVNGWTCGNIVSTPTDIARFHSDLHEGRIVSASSLVQMTDFVAMDQGWAPQKYGLGIMVTWPFRDRLWAPDPEGITRTVGHAGQDYGSLSQMAGYNLKYGFGFAVATNGIVGMNCTMAYAGNWSSWEVFFNDAVCELYDDAIQLVTNGTAPRLNCSLCPNCPFVPRVSPNCTATMDRLCSKAKAAGPVKCIHCMTDPAVFNATTTAGCGSHAPSLYCGNKPLPATPPRCSWANI